MPHDRELRFEPDYEEGQFFEEDFNIAEQAEIDKFELYEELYGKEE
jgi:hypothetical protein